MLSYVKRIGKNSFYYIFAQVLTKAIGFFLIPVYTRVLIPDDYGIIAIITTVTVIFSMFCDMGLRGAIGTFYFDYYRDPEQLRGYISTILLFLFPYSLVLTIATGLWGSPFIQPLLGEIPFNPYVFLALGIGFCQVFFEIVKTLYQAQEESTRYALVSVLSFVTGLLLIIYFVVFRREGALGNTTAQFISALIFFILSIYLLKDFLVLRLDVQKLWASLKFGLPLVPHMLSGWILTAADRLFLNRYTGLSEVGLYSLGYKLGDIMNIVTASINYAWMPFFMSTAKEKGANAKSTFARLTTYYLAVIFFFALLLTVPAREIVAVLATAQYQDAYKVVPIITFGWVLGGMYYMVVNQIFYTKKTKFLPLATFGAGLIQLLLNSVWVPKYGMMGSAWAMFVAQLGSFLFTWYISHRVYPMHFEYARIARAILVTGGLLAASFMINIASVWYNLLAKMLLLSGYPLLLFVVGFFGQDELLKAREVVSRWLAQRGYLVKG